MGNFLSKYIYIHIRLYDCLTHPLEGPLADDHGVLHVVARVTDDRYHCVGTLG